MRIVYAMHDALVSINFPSGKAKAVIDAMEREMMDRIATRDDLIHAQQILSRDMERIQERVKSELATLETRLTVRMGRMMAAMIGTATALLGTVDEYYRMAEATRAR
jgi:hypothetical protein